MNYNQVEDSHWKLEDFFQPEMYPRYMMVNQINKYNNKYNKLLIYLHFL